MTRCVYLTFFGEYRGHGHPHESPRRSRAAHRARRLPIVAGFLNAAAVRHREVPSGWSPTVAFPHLVHPEFDYADGGRLVSLVVLGIGIAASTLVPTRGARAAQGPHPAQQARARRATRSSRTSTTSTTSTRTSSSAASRARSPGVVLVQPARDRRGRQRRRAAPRSLGSVRVRTSTRRGSTAPSTASPRAPATPVGSCVTSNRAGCSGTRCSCSPAVGSWPSLLYLVTMLTEGNHAMELVRRLGADPGGLPPTGRHGDRAADPEGRGGADQGGRARHHAWSPSRWASASWPTSTTASPPAVQGQRAVDPRDPHPLPHGDRRHLAAAARPLDVHHGPAASSTPGTTSPSRTTRRRSSP